MEASKLKQVLDQHKLWVETNEVQGERANLSRANLSRANLKDANLSGANLYNADLRGAILRDANLEDVSFINANLTGANLTGANLTITHFQNASLDSIIGLPDVSWIIPGCLVRLYKFRQHFFVTKENKLRNLNFAQDSFGFFIQNNVEEKTFDMLVEDRIIRNIPDWVKYSGLKQIESV